MPKTPSLTPKKLVKILQQKGFVQKRQKGSHIIFKNLQNNKRVIVPFHTKDLKKGTLLSILREAEIGIKELRK